MKSSRTPIAVALTALALAAPAAQAKPSPATHWRAVTAVNAADTEAQALASRGQGTRVSQYIEAQRLASHGKSAPAPRVESADSGFDWTAAAVGGGGAVTIALLASLGVGVAGRRGVRTAR